MRTLVSLVITIATTGTALAQAPSEMPPQPQPPPSEGPPPFLQAPPGIHISFISTDDLPWDVTIDRQLACTTPCELMVPPSGYVAMHSHEDPPVFLAVGRLPLNADLVAAEPIHRGEYATGVTFTALGATALATGLTLGVIGYATDSSGLKTAGWATGIPGAVVTLGAIWLIQRAAPRAHIQLSRQF